MRRWALVNKDSKIIDNVISWDGVSYWTPPDNYDLIECGQTDDAEPGGKYEDGKFLTNEQVRQLYYSSLPQEETIIESLPNEVTTEPTVI